MVVCCAVMQVLGQEWREPLDSTYLVSAAAILPSNTSRERAENYTIRCTTGTSGEITTSELVYEGLFREDPEQILIVMTDCNRIVSEHCVPIAQACEFYTGAALLPTKAPDSIIGTTAYYHWRYTDCRIRNCVMGNSSSVPDYYLNYGEKYARRFNTEVRPKLSREGQQWLDETVLLFQLATEALVLENGSAELNDRDFRRQLFDLHPKVYEATGFFDLPLRDRLLIARHLDAKDLFSREGRIQIRQLARDYVPYLGKKLIVKIAG